MKASRDEDGVAYWNQQRAIALSEGECSKNDQDYFLFDCHIVSDHDTKIKHRNKPSSSSEKGFSRPLPLRLLCFALAEEGGKLFARLADL